MFGMTSGNDMGMAYGLMAFGNSTTLIGIDAQRSFAAMTGQMDKLTGDAAGGTNGGLL